MAKSPEISRQSGGVVAADTASEVLPVVVGLKAAQVHGSVSKKGRRGVDKKIVTGSAHQESKLITNIEVSPLEKVEHHEMDSSKGATRRSTRINAKYLNQGTPTLCSRTDKDHMLGSFCFCLPNYRFILLSYMTLTCNYQLISFFLKNSFPETNVSRNYLGLRILMSCGSFCLFYEPLDLCF